MHREQRIAVVGTGYVGTVVAACFAALGHRVIGLEVDPTKLRSLQAGEPPFFEPGLDDLLAIQVQKGTLSFTADVRTAMDASDLVFLCVGTPQGEGGNADMGAVEAAGREIARAIDRHHVIVTKSTVPVGTGYWLRAVMEEETSVPFSIVSNPEFLRQGSAIRDFLHPDRVVLGSDDEGALEAVQAAYEPILQQTFANGDPSAKPELIASGITTAETIKYASNAFLATKISFINEIAQICERVGADVTDVAAAMGLDPRIGPKFLRAGIGWGGSCFGKDIDALRATAEDYGYDAKILRAVRQVNTEQSGLAVAALQKRLKPMRGRRVALLGLAFKPATDDVREAPALGIARQLLGLGAIVTAHDPVVAKVDSFPELRTFTDPYAALEGAEAAVLVTEWPQFEHLDLDRVADVMAGDLFFDGRNVIDPEAARAAGLRYHGIGRGPSTGWD